MCATSTVRSITLKVRYFVLDWSCSLLEPVDVIKFIIVVFDDDEDDDDDSTSNIVPGDDV